MPALRQDLVAGPSVEFRRVGRNNATTFTGLCSEHDNAMFAPIDKADIDIADARQLFLVAYRSVLRELHAVVSSAMKVQAAYRKKVELGLCPGDRPTPLGLAATEFYVNACDFHDYKRSYDAAYLNESFDDIAHECMVLEDARVTIAASTCFTRVELAQRPGDEERIVLNVFPQGGRVYVVFSYRKTDRDFVVPHLMDIMKATGPRRKYLLSQLVLQNSDNFVISPSFFAEWSQPKIETVKKYVFDTILGDKPEFEDEHLYLF